jgi:cytochrome b subunit of formate dehydrogenase
MFGIPDAMARQWRVALASLAAAGFSLSAALTYTVERGIHWSLVLPGFVIAVAGFQIQAAIRLARRFAPDRLRPWMVALPTLLYVIGGACLVIGLWALALHGAAI